MSRTTRFTLLGVLAVLVVFVVYQLSAIKVAPPAADASTFHIVVVKRGTIRLGDRESNNVLYVERPIHAAENTTMRILKVVDNDRVLESAKVQFGLASENYIEVLNGLKEGDRIVQSDMSAWKDFDRVLLR